MCESNDNIFQTTQLKPTQKHISNKITIIDTYVDHVKEQNFMRDQLQDGKPNNLAVSTTADLNLSASFSLCNI